MIYDAINNSGSYFSDDLHRKAFEFLSNLTADAEEKEYPLDGERCFARVMSYMTKLPDAHDVVVECHRRYADIQMTLTGLEAIHCFHQGGLVSKNGYDADKDVEFFRNNPSPDSIVVNHPGMFTYLLPQDIHRPQMAPPGHQPALVKKVVVKVQTA